MKNTAKDPELAHKIEPAFECNGKQYYTFKADTDMRYGRYVVMQTYLQEYFLRVDLNTLKEDIKSLKDYLNPAAKTARIELGKALELLEIMGQRADIAFEPETVYRLASCLYFDDTEIITEYDRKYNELKIKSWKEANTVDFFFNRLFIELTGLKVTSKDALMAYLQQAPELIKGWRNWRDILKR